MTLEIDIVTRGHAEAMVDVLISRGTFKQSGGLMPLAACFATIALALVAGMVRGEDEEEDARGEAQLRKLLHKWLDQHFDLAMETIRERGIV